MNLCFFTLVVNFNCEHSFHLTRRHLSPSTNHNNQQRTTITITSTRQGTKWPACPPAMGSKSRSNRQQLGSTDVLKQCSNSPKRRDRPTDRPTAIDSGVKQKHVRSLPSLAIARFFFFLSRARPLFLFTLLPLSLC